MSLKEIIKPFIPNLILEARKRILLKRWEASDIGINNFAFNEEISVKKDISDKYGYSGDFVDLYAGNKDSVRKWHHYIPLYDRYFSPFRGRNIRLLEIGVLDGGSLQMWRNYFGDDAIIFGIDIDSKCEKYNGLAGQVRIGSQDDKKFLESVIEEMGGIDIVLDDGSHHMDHIPASLKYLFPHLNESGIYMIEDLHTAYWRRFGGGYRSKKNFFRFIMDLVDDIHHWYHKKGLNQSAIAKIVLAFIFTIR